MAITPEKRGRLDRIVPRELDRPVASGRGLLAAGVPRSAQKVTLALAEGYDTKKKIRRGGFATLWFDRGGLWQDHRQFVRIAFG